MKLISHVRDPLVYWLCPCTGRALAWSHIPIPIPQNIITLHLQGRKICKAACPQCGRLLWGRVYEEINTSGLTRWLYWYRLETEEAYRRRTHRNTLDGSLFQGSSGEVTVQERSLPIGHWSVSREWWRYYTTET